MIPGWLTPWRSRRARGGAPPVDGECPGGEYAEWEYEVAADLVPYLVRPGRWGHPYRPSRVDPTLARMARVLAGSVGHLAARDLFVVPAGIRPGGARHIYTPTRVLGFGTRGVGLCVDGLPEPLVLTAVDYPDIVGIGEEHEAGTSALLLHAGTGTVTLRYLSDGAHPLQQLLIGLRHRLAPQPAPVPAGWPDVAAPPRWRGVLESTVVRLHTDDLVAAVFARVAAAGRMGAEACLVALTPWELVVARGPWAAGATTTLHVPRRRLRGVNATARALRIYTDGPALDASAGPWPAPTLRILLTPTE